jgi:hypothetical protein
MRYLWSAAILLALAASEARAQTECRTAAIGTPVPEVIHPIWLRRPNGNQIYDAWRQSSISTDIKDARVTMRCKVTSDGRLDQCTILTSQPADLGFEALTLKMARWFLMSNLTEDCRPVAGADVIIPIHFLDLSQTAGPNRP